MLRQELYDLVWSDPISHIAKRYGVSDVTFAKICRGAGKRVTKPPPLPARTRHDRKHLDCRRIHRGPLR